MAASGPVPLHIITGFLGSGKTTLLNRLLHAASGQGKKVGVIVNEWGRINIDGRLIAHDGIELAELNNGQLFCSCLSASFVQALVLFARHPLDAVFVETSGMANPLPLKELFAEMEKLTGRHYAYQGMTALVDPESFLELAEVVNADRGTDHRPPAHHHQQSGSRPPGNRAQGSGKDPVAQLISRNH